MTVGSTPPATRPRGFSIETRRLQYFLTIVELGSITRAAAKLGIAQPALSQQLMILEREVGAKLFERSVSGARPTPAGDTLLARARLVVRHVDALRDELSNGRVTMRGTVTVGLLPTIGMTIGAPLLAAAIECLPTIRLKLSEGGNSRLIEWLLNGLIDVALLASRPADAAIASTPLFSEPLVIVGSPQVAGAPPRDLTALAQAGWVVPSAPNAMRTMLAGLFAEEGMEPHIVAEIDSLPMVVQAVGLGLGLTLMPQSTVSGAIDRGELAIMATPLREIRRTIHLCHLHANAQAPGMADLVRLIGEIGRGGGA